MSHNFQICPIDFALHGDNVPYDIFAFKITGYVMLKYTWDIIIFWAVTYTEPTSHDLHWPSSIMLFSVSNRRCVYVLKAYYGRVGCDC